MGELNGRVAVQLALSRRKLPQKKVRASVGAKCYRRGIRRHAAGREEGSNGNRLHKRSSRIGQAGEPCSRCTGRGGQAKVRCASAVACARRRPAGTRAKRRGVTLCNDRATGRHDPPLGKRQCRTSALRWWEEGDRCYGEASRRYMPNAAEGLKNRQGRTGSASRYALKGAPLRKKKNEPTLVPRWRGAGRCERR